MKLSPNDRMVLTGKKIELQFIVKRCDQGGEISNSQIRSMLSTLSSSFQSFLSILETNTIQNIALISKAKQNTITDGQIYERVEEQLNALRQIVSKKVNALDLKIEKSIQISQSSVYQTQEKAAMEVQQKLLLLSKSNSDSMQQIKILDKRLSKFDKELKQSQVNVSEDFELLKDEVNQIKIKTEELFGDFQSGKNYQKLNLRLQKCEQHLKKTNNMLSLDKKQIKIVQHLREQKQIDPTIKKKYHKFEELQFVDQEIKAIEWVDTSSFNHDRLQLINNTVVCRDWVNVFGTRDLGNYLEYTVTANLFKDRMYLGIIDSSLRGKEFLDGQSNWIIYGSNGYCWNGKVKKFEQGKGFKIGEDVTIKVDFDECKVIWKVGKKIHHHCETPQLKNDQIKWVASIWMVDKGDQFKIVE